MKEHNYDISVHWTGNLGNGTPSYAAFSRDHEISVAGKRIAIPGSSDAHFRGDASRYNPEELLVASLSACHMLWYLHLCAVNDVVVTGYDDRASGTMLEEKDGRGRFSRVVLRPRVTISPESDREKALELHKDAHRMCFIANSVRFAVVHEPEIARDFPG